MCPDTDTVPAARQERLEALLSPELKALFQRAADLQGRNLTDFMVTTLQEAARRTIEEMEIIRLNLEDSRAFAQALMHSREPSRRVKDAARRYLEAAQE